MINLKKHTIIALGYFLIIALLGMLMRLFPVVDIPINYRFIVHTHSHIALLGWIYTGLTTLIYKLYLSGKEIDRKYKFLFWCTQATIVGMLLTFPVEGYALSSIVFSTLFLLASYGFVWFFIKYTSEEQKKTGSYKFIRTALWYMVISSIGPWALGIIMNTFGSTSPWYRNAVYFFLHFQYNGWFIVALFGLLFFMMERHHIIFPKGTFNRFFWIFNVGVVFTYFLSVLWMQPHPLFYLLAGIGAVAQCIAFVMLIKGLLPIWNGLKDTLSSNVVLMLKTASLLFSFKIILQFFGSIPYIATMVSNNMDFIMGYLHWTFLGVVSIALLAFLHHFKLLYLPKKLYLLYLTGFILTEGLLFYKGTVVWLGYTLMEDYFTLLATTSFIFLIAIAGILTAQLTKKSI